MVKNSLANLSLLDNDIGFVLMNSGCMKYGGTSGELSLVDRSAAGANFKEVIVPCVDRKVKPSVGLLTALQSRKEI